MEWISVKDRLPEGHMKCIVAISNYSTSASFLKGEWWQCGEVIDDDCKITHWMPLPEPPEE
jgi:hypothetical protein